MQQQDIVYFYNVHSQPFSNFYPSPFTVADKIYQTAQHFYQSKKFEGTQKQQQVRTSPTIQSCHYMGQSYSSTFNHQHWDSVRQQVYEQAMRHKFTQNKDLMDKLLMTDNRQIINIDDDTFWGMKFDDLQGKLTGENKTGKILMKIRDQFNKVK